MRKRKKTRYKPRDTYVYAANPGVKVYGGTLRHFRCKAVGTEDANTIGAWDGGKKWERRQSLLEKSKAPLNRHVSAWSASLLADLMCACSYWRAD